MPPKPEFADVEPEHLPELGNETPLLTLDRLVSAKDALVELLSIGVSERVASRVMTKYPHDGLQRVQANPWLLAHEFRSTWAQADAVARGALDRRADDPQRICSAVLTELISSSRDGHCYEVLHTVCRDAGHRLQLSPDAVRDFLLDETMLESAPLVVEDGKRVWLSWYYRAEETITAVVQALLAQPKLPVPDLAAIEGLGDEQLAALRLMLSEPICVVTGFPGTGKTHCQRLALAALPANVSTLLCAPTGKASRRMSELSGRPASTIHRALGFKPPHGFQLYQVEQDWVLLDEGSMVDLGLAAQLLKRVDPARTRVTFIGDVDQLPPVGPGTPFRDIIESQKVPVARLTKLYRQAEASWVCRNAPRVLQGRGVEMDDVDDFEFWDATDLSAEETAEQIVQLVQKLLADGHSWDDFVVQTPMRKKGTPLATSDLNPRIQRACNPVAGRNHLWLGDLPLLPGDRVIQNKNNYDLEVFNGDIGTVREIVDKRRDTPAGALIDFGPGVGERVYPVSEFELLHAYALTGHKMQGSESPIAVVVCHSVHSFMLTRKLLYTMLTRAKKKVILVGDQAGVRRALATVRDDGRRTQLKRRLECLS